MASKEEETFNMVALAQSILGQDQINIKNDKISTPNTFQPTMTTSLHQDDFHMVALDQSSMKNQDDRNIPNGNEDFNMVALAQSILSQSDEKNSNDTRSTLHESSLQPTNDFNMVAVAQSVLSQPDEKSKQNEITISGPQTTTLSKTEKPRRRDFDKKTPSKKGSQNKDVSTPATVSTSESTAASPFLSMEVGATKQTVLETLENHEALRLPPKSLNRHATVQTWVPPAWSSSSDVHVPICKTKTPRVHAGPKQVVALSHPSCWPFIKRQTRTRNPFVTPTLSPCPKGQMYEN